MKMILEFNLPEEQTDANQALNVGKLNYAISEYKQELRRIIKHSQDDDEVKNAEWAQGKLLQFLDDEIVAIFEL